MALEDTLPNITAYVARKRDVKTGSVRKEIKNLLQGAVEETGRGVSLGMEWFSCVGRKEL